MEDIFSTSSKIIEKQIELEEDDQQQELKKFIERDFDSYFDINKIVKWLTENKFSRIALQFPDEMLNNSIRVCARLKEAAPNVLFFILADTSYGSCCADVVAAQHYNADALIHFGHSCLSPVEKLPVFYVFEKLLVNLDYVEAELNRISGLNPTKKFVVLYDIAYFYLYDELVKKFSKNPNIYVSRIKMPNESDDGENVEEKLLFSRTFPKDLKTANDSHEFVYIGHKENTLTSLMFYFNRSKFYKFDTSTRGQSQVTEMPFSRTNRDLMRRYYLIEKARDTRIFGILVGTMSVANYREAIRHVEGLLKKAGRRYYSFLIGKLNCPKLNNFMEVDMYVMISCNENSLINSKELNKPIITVFELEMAFNSARVWGEEFVCDFRQLLPGSEHYLETKLSDREADVSLITGETRFFNRDINHNSENQKSLANRNDGLSLMHYSGAGEFLQNRSWVGLEQNLGQTEVSKAVEGKKGIAANYEDEFKT